jgi:phasin family protein
MLSLGKVFEETNVSDIQGQAVVTQQANLDFYFGVAGKMLECAENLVKLNFDVAKSTFSDWYQGMQDKLTKTGQREASGLQSELALPSVKKVTTYQRQIAEIASTTQTQLAEVIDAHYQQASRQAQWFIEKVAQSTPVNSEPAVAFLTQIRAIADTAHVSMHKAAKHTANIAQSSVNAVTETTESTDEVADEATKAAKH